MAVNERAKRIGVVVVHGIGEQRRFEHLDGQVRQLVAALKMRPGCEVSTEIHAGWDSPFGATAAAWSEGHPVSVFVREAGQLTQIEFHEVWWADVNEPYSLGKQIRFWLWTLAIWLIPEKRGSLLPQALHVTAPSQEGLSGRLKEIWIRMRLLGVAIVAVAAACSIGLITFLLERVLKIQAPDLLRTFVSYVAGVKLYNQKERRGPGLPGSPADFLDTLQEPPRVSVRRRMIQVLMSMARGQYERWYVLAHSLGSVVAFNGLMETAYTWPGYLDQETWDAARTAAPPLAGAHRSSWTVVGEPEAPARPVWLTSSELVYRSRVFERFQGFVTFGCPLEKFAALWPARVPITKEPAFRLGTRWFNIFDPTDPVSGVLTSFDVPDQHCCPSPTNLGFAAGPGLLLSHLKYLRASARGDGLADAFAHWVVTGDSSRMGKGPDWFMPGSARQRRRRVLAWCSWAMALALLCVAGGIVLPLAGRAVRGAVCESGAGLGELKVPLVHWQCTPSKAAAGTKS